LGGTCGDMSSRRLLSVLSSSGMLCRTHRCCTASAIENLRPQQSLRAFYHAHSNLCRSLRRSGLQVLTPYAQGAIASTRRPGLQDTSIVMH